MHGPLGDREDLTKKPATSNALVAALDRTLSLLNGIILVFASLALVAA